MTADDPRTRLLELAVALHSRKKALRRDECGDWRIGGTRGHIYAVPEGFQIYVRGTARAWGFAKRALSFAKVGQDGDNEGFLILDRLPTEQEAETIRRYCGISKRAQLSPERAAELGEKGRLWAKNRARAGATVSLPQDGA